MKIAYFENGGDKQYGVIQGEKIFQIKGDIFGDFQITDNGIPLETKQT
jgi:hypothetical protein